MKDGATLGVEWWDTREGKVLKRDTAKAAGGAVRLTVPAFSRDIACKVGAV